MNARPEDRRQMATGTWRAWLVVLALAAGAVAALMNLAVFPAYSLNRDDSVYVAAARMLESGRLTLPAGDDAFRPWASAVVGDRIVLKYSPPWPVVIAVADLLTGRPWVALAATAALTVVVVALLTDEVLRDRTTAVVAGGLALLSPVVVIQSGTFLPYLFQLAVSVSAVVLLLRGVRRRSGVLLLLAGVVGGVAVFARPFDALLTIGPFVVVAAFACCRRAGAQSLTPGSAVVWLAAGALPVLALMVTYNTVILGGPFRLPFTVTGPNDTFGFGDRGVFPGSTIPFGPRDGLTGLLLNVQATPSWVFGSFVLVALAVWGTVVSRGAARWAVVSLAAVVPLGYLAFWGPWAISTQWAGLQLFGPFYYLPVLLPLVVLGAAGLVTLARRLRPVWVPAGLAVLMTVLTGLSLRDPLAGNLAVRDDLQAVARFVRDQHLENAVLLLPRRGDSGFFGTTPSLANDPDLRQSVLYAEERGGRDLELVRRFPGRGLYRLSEDLPPGRPTGGALTIDRLRVQTGTVITTRFRLTNITDEPVVVAYLTDGRRTWTRTLDRSSARGRTYEVSWTLAAPEAETADSNVVRVTGPSVLAVGLEVQPTDTGDVDGHGSRWERRVAVDAVDAGATLQLLRPGEGWARAGIPGTEWRSAGRDNPVTELELAGE